MYKSTVTKHNKVSNILLVLDENSLIFEIKLIKDSAL